MHRRTIALLAFLLAALIAVPAAAVPPPQNVPPRHTVAERNYADAPPVPEGFGAASVGTVEDDSGDEIPGLTVEKVACKNSSQTTSNGYIVYEGACGLRYSDGLNRGKFRVTIYRISTGEPAYGNVGWNASPPHYRRVYAYPGGVKTVEAGTWQRDYCPDCHSTVAYSLRDCDYPVSAQKQAETKELKIRVGGALYSPFIWYSNLWVGCGI